ncbi:MAG: site-2 protease family protein [Fimbriimonadaceae bacterium]|nr:site-2 protease family protein [Fimbriimonadaceae bacterium]
MDELQSGNAPTPRAASMRWSASIGKVLGIDLRIHAAFPLLLVWAGWTGYALRSSWADAREAVVFVLLLFAVVILHELGHAMAARRYGIETRDITMLPIGGLARLERMPEDPKQELVIALAGPAVNVLLAVPLAAIVILGGASLGANPELVGQWSIWERLLATNIVLAVFNMVPAFPMDGGRVLRALMAMRMPYVQATNVAAAIGQGFAILMGFAGLVLNPFLILIAVFVWIGAAQEAMGVRFRAAFQGVRVSDVMVRSFQTLNADAPLAEATTLLMTGFQAEFPVMEEGRVVGCLTKNDLVRGLSESEGRGTVAQFATREICLAHASEPLIDALKRLDQDACRVMPVVDFGGTLVGLLTPDNIAEFLMVHSAGAKPLPQSDDPQWQL